MAGKYLSNINQIEEKTSDGTISLTIADNNLDYQKGDRIIIKDNSDNIVLSGTITSNFIKNTSDKINVQIDNSTAKFNINSTNYKLDKQSSSSPAAPSASSSLTAAPSSSLTAAPSAVAAKTKTSINEEINKYKNIYKFINTTREDDIYGYFDTFPKGLEELFGKDIITRFYSTQYLFKKLEKICNMMKELLELNKDKLNMEINRNNYLFNRANFIFFNKFTLNYEDDFNNLFDTALQSVESKISETFIKNDKDFISKFLEIDGVINCLSNTQNPFFYNLFNENYNGPSKDFFMKLFEEYCDIRKQILNVCKLDKNAGILSLEPFIKNDIKINNSNNVKQKSNNKKNSNNENAFENAVFYNNTPKNLYNGLNIRPTAYGPKKSNAFKIIETNKTNYSLLYKKNMGNTDDKHLNEMRRIFKELHDNLYSPDGIVSFDRKRPLYDILMKSIMIDYSSLIFFYSFIESVKFRIIINAVVKTNSYINDNIKLYKQNLPAFLSWKRKSINKNELKSNQNNIEPIDEEGLIFQKTLEKFFDGWNSKISIFKNKYANINKKNKEILNIKNAVKLINSAYKKPPTKIGKMKEKIKSLF
jgi:hypothetical protein